MLRSVLVALNGTASSDAASELAIRSSKHYGCTLTGIGFVDDPGLRDYHLSGHSHATTMLYDEALKQARTQIKDMLELFERRCQSANIVVHAVSCENEPYEDLAFEAVRHDIVMIGSEASIHRCREGYDVLDMLKHVPRPIVVVPELLPDGDVVLIAYDGSVQAGRTLQAFLASGCAGIGR